MWFIIVHDHATEEMGREVIPWLGRRVYGPFADEYAARTFRHEYLSKVAVWTIAEYQGLEVAEQDERR